MNREDKELCDANFISCVFHAHYNTSYGRTGWEIPSSINVVVVVVVAAALSLFFTVIKELSRDLPEVCRDTRDIYESLIICVYMWNREMWMLGWKYSRIETLIYFLVVWCIVKQTLSSEWLIYQVLAFNNKCFTIQLRFPVDEMWFLFCYTIKLSHKFTKSTA